MVLFASYEKHPYDMRKSHGQIYAPWWLSLQPNPLPSLLPSQQLSLRPRRSLRRSERALGK